MKSLFSALLIVFFYNLVQSQTPEKFSGEELVTKISYYDSVIKLGPHSDTYYNRGYLHFLAKNYNEALLDYDKAISIDTTNYQLYFNRAMVRNALKYYNGAISDYSKVIKLDSKNYKSFYSRGLIKKELHDISGAISDFTKAIEIDPKNTYSYLYRGNLKLDNKKYNEAIKDFNKVIELDPSNFEAIQNRGISKASIGDKDALKDFNKLIALDPTGEAYTNRALYYLHNNYKLDYCSDLRKAVNLGYEPAKDFIKQYCK